MDSKHTPLFLLILLAKHSWHFLFRVQIQSTWSRAPIKQLPKYSHLSCSIILSSRMGMSPSTNIKGSANLGYYNEECRMKRHLADSQKCLLHHPVIPCLFRNSQLRTWRKVLPCTERPQAGLTATESSRKPAISSVVLPSLSFQNTSASPEYTASNDLTCVELLLFYCWGSHVYKTDAWQTEEHLHSPWCSQNVLTWTEWIKIYDFFKKIKMDFLI